jgi:hypothetical protein
LNNGGLLVLEDCILQSNRVQQASGLWAQGGAIDNRGTVTALRCMFQGNQAQGVGFAWDGMVQTWGRPGVGGAVFNSGVLSLSACSFIGNSAIGGEGGDDPFGWGYGGTGGQANGGAIYNEHPGTVFLRDSIFAGNQSIGGEGGDSGMAQDPWFPQEYVAAAGGQGGFGGGSAIRNASGALRAVNIVNCTIVTNHSFGGPGGAGGISQIPGVPNGAGGYGGDGCAAIYGPCCLTNCTIANNSSSGGIGGPGSIQGPNGGTVGTVVLMGSDGVMINTIVVNDTPEPTVSESMTDAGHNLISDSSVHVTHPTSITNTDPKLGPLQNNDGPTWTMALLPGSPALDAGDDAAAPPTDQRGVPRPFGAASDIGAYEASAPILLTLPPTQTVEAGSSVHFAVTTFGDPASAFFWLLGETTLISAGPDPER